MLSMLCPLFLVLVTMLFIAGVFSLVGFFVFHPVYVTTETACPDGRYCPQHWVCCDKGCCVPPTAPPRRDIEDALKEQAFMYPWYAQWPVLFFIATLAGILVCCVWCLFFKRSSRDSVYMYSFTCCGRRQPSERDSAGSAYPPPRYSRCGSIHQPPPPYSEVTSKPDMYPLVITYGDNDGKATGNYLMVHYFRNYLIRNPGSISATSTAESLNSSCLCSAANEANTIIPPPYSCASNYEPCGGLLRSMSSLSSPRRPPRPLPGVSPRGTVDILCSPVTAMDPAYELELELIDCDLYDSGCKPCLGSSPRLDHRPNLHIPDPFPLSQLFSRSPEMEGVSGDRESPPLPTSPTQNVIQIKHRRIDTAKARKSSLYMPLSNAYARRSNSGGKVTSKSAPATPSGALVPSLLSLSQRVSRHSSRSSKFDEESDPLLDPEPFGG